MYRASLSSRYLAIILWDRCTVSLRISDWLDIKKTKGNTAVIQNLNSRINAWWIMVLIIGITFYIGNMAVIMLFFFISLCSLKEFIAVISTTNQDRYAVMFSFYLVLPVQYLLIAMQWYGFFSIFIPVYAFLLLPIFISITGETHSFLARAAKIQWGIMITIYAISCVPALLTLNINGYADRNLLLIAFLVIVVQLSDVLQYVFGKLFGQHKIAPNLSPSKTIEGFFGPEFNIQVPSN